MLTLSAQAKTALLARTPQYVKRVYIRRRRWENGAYGLMDPLEITDRLVECGTLKWKLDTETYGVWTLDNCAVVFSNMANEWKEGNPAGLFPDGTILYASAIEIRSGIKLPDGGEEMFCVFRGQVKQNPVYNGEEKTVSLTVYGSLAELKDFSAEDVSNSVDNELMGSDSGSEFSTANPAAGVITAVKKGIAATGPEQAETLLPSTDYTTGGLNEYAAGATVTLKQALLPGQALWISYKYWHTDKTIEWIVARLCETAAITDTLITPVVFDCDVKNTFSQTTAEEFDEGSDCQTDHSGGDVTMSASFVPNVTGAWTATETPGNIGGWNNSSPEVALTAFGQASDQWACARQSQPLAYGTWQAAVNLTVNNFGNVHYYYHFIASGASRAASSGYCLKWALAEPGRHSCTLYRADSGGLTALWSGVIAVNLSAAYATVRVARSLSGAFMLWVYDPCGGWQTIGQIASDTTHTGSESQFVAFNYWLSEDATCYMSVSGISASDQTATGCGSYHVRAYYTSPVIDGTDSVSSWRVTASESKPDGTATLLEYQSSTDDAEWSGWTAVPSTGTLPTTDQYLRLRWNAYSDSTQTLAPTLAQWSVYYYTSRITIPVVNMTNLNCYEAVCSLAEMCAYETGFDSSGRFVFRPRTSALPACETLDENRVIETITVNEGIDRVYNSVTVNFGDYSCVADCASQDCARPHSQDKYGTRKLSVSSGNFLPDSNTNLAYAAAPTIFNFTAEKRRQATLRTAFMPWLELGDKISVSLPENTALENWVWGNAPFPFGYSRQEYYSQADARARYLLYGFTARIAGMEFDLENYFMTLNLTEA
ncbi:MAG: hypothetical protein PHW69_02660 [Elusimicrobiaceae bacterium]|nr:hypothetical protein [Elusimicrobiaceae bacterium]